MDNCITDILDNGIKEIKYSQRIPSSAITYQLDNYSTPVTINMPFNDKKRCANTIIDKTMSLFQGNKKGDYSNKADANRVMTSKHQREFSKENKVKNNNHFKSDTNIKNQNANGKKINWESKFEELRQKTEEAKKSLVTERKKGKELEKQFNRLKKKEQQYNELIDINQQMLQTNENLYKKVEANDKIVNEQEDIIYSLQLEIKRYTEVMNKTALK